MSSAVHLNLAIIERWTALITVGEALSFVMQDHDIVAVRQPDGRYQILRWDELVGQMLQIPDHGDLYDELEMYRRLKQLRSSGDTYVADWPNRPDVLRLVE